MAEWLILRPCMTMLKLPAWRVAAGRGGLTRIRGVPGCGHYPVMQCRGVYGSGPITLRCYIKTSA